MLLSEPDDRLNFFDGGRLHHRRGVVLRPSAVPERIAKLERGVTDQHVFGADDGAKRVQRSLDLRGRKVGCHRCCTHVLSSVSSRPEPRGRHRIKPTSILVTVDSISGGYTAYVSPSRSSPSGNRRGVAGSHEQSTLAEHVDIDPSPAAAALLCLGRLPQPSARGYRAPHSPIVHPRARHKSAS